MVGNASGCFKNGIFLLPCLGTFSLIYGGHPWTCRSRSLQAQLANLQTTFVLHFLFKKKLEEGTSTRLSKVTLPFSLTFSVVFFMLSPHNKPAFPALIPPSFTSLNPFVTFFRPLQPHSSSHNQGKYENSRFNSDAFSYI